MYTPKPRKLDSGSFFIQLRLGGESVPITTDTEKECIQLAQFAKAEYLAGKRVSKKKLPELPTLGEAVDNYIAARTNTLSPSTIRGYKTIRENRFTDMMSEKIDSMTDVDWIKACNAEAALCSAKTLTNAWRFIASVLRENNIVPPKVSLPQIISNERAFLEPEQISVFIEAVKGTDVEIPALLALSSLRRSEILALTWDNVNLKQKRIQVKGATVPDENNKLVTKKENKNKSSARYVPIMIDELLNALKIAKGEGDTAKTKGAVVSLHPDTMRVHINRICKNADLPEVGVHGLRHSFASLAYHLGVPEKITMEIGGWSDSQTMRKIYTHVAKSDTKRYETELNKFFNKKKSKKNNNANDNANT